ncbi:hypothetical protein CC85DRAFT_305995 [Cutaneotrichosporon oleaginosum]|uniref:Uncharacterized protein n=1 Tax=Cutaneotrichosporon oleaginosum TaxID=879819 RepID=A0A0J1ASW5_9TREE|nr:uncharacterized protein CC85DRAFT_305995 [Cutaneotrichosporon oleaginosum]KLT38404.1 hypothetical protein CC85DRAFT_305995 [Cutaneotrichosporon oleaginosum]TXT09499.1 hypothetical protein COLE_03433 [Cutaneotrichosporon oleaginosum]
MSPFHFRRRSSAASNSSASSHGAETSTATPVAPSTISTAAVTPSPSAVSSPSASSVSIIAPHIPAFTDDVEVSIPARGSRLGDALRRAKRWIEVDDVDGLSFDPVKSLQPSKLSWHTI